MLKKANTTECCDFRTISLIPHASKIMLKVITRRVQGKAKDFISDTVWFQKGTWDAMGVMRILVHRRLKFGNELYVCFVDFERLLIE